MCVVLDPRWSRPTNGRFSGYNFPEFAAERRTDKISWSSFLEQPWKGVDYVRWSKTGTIIKVWILYSSIDNSYQ
jgi:hypothetical protein